VLDAAVAVEAVVAMVVVICNPLRWIWERFSLDDNNANAGFHPAQAR
jgi:hypothetical protein